MDRFTEADCLHCDDGINFEIHFDNKGDDVSTNDGNSPIVIVAIGAFFIILFTLCCCICIKQFYFRRQGRREPQHITIHATGVFTITNNSTPPPRYDELTFPSTSLSVSSDSQLGATPTYGGVAEDGASAAIPLEPPPPYDSILFDSSRENSNSGGHTGRHVQDRDEVTTQSTRSDENDQSVENEEIGVGEQSFEDASQHSDNPQNEDIDGVASSQSEYVTQRDDSSIRGTCRLSTEEEGTVAQNDDMTQNEETTESYQETHSVHIAHFEPITQSEQTCQGEHIPQHTEESSNNEEVTRGKHQSPTDVVTDGGDQYNPTTKDERACQANSLVDTDSPSTKDPPFGVNSSTDANSQDVSNAANCTYSTDVAFV